MSRTWHMQTQLVSLDTDNKKVEKLHLNKLNNQKLLLWYKSKMFL